MKLTLCLLSWQSHRTLLNTLESYERLGLFRRADEKLIYFQERSRKDERIARRYGLECLGSARNVGIGAAYHHLAHRATGDAVLFLQNDFVLVEDLDRDPSELTSALRMLERKEIDVALFRHRRHPGLPHWAEDHVRGNEARWPSHLFNTLYWMEHPETRYPAEIQRSPSDPRFLVTTSRYMNYTDNPSLYRRDWLLETLGERFVANGPDRITWPEVVIQPWWEQQDFRIAQAEGLFTHIRLDRDNLLRRARKRTAAALRRVGLYGVASRLRQLVRKR